MKYIITILAFMLFSLPVLADTTTTKATTDSSKPEMKSDVIKKVSPYSVNKTMDKFEAIVKKKGFAIFARIDHKKNAQTVDMDMNEAQVLIFGNPKGGTLLMKQDIGVSLDLPLRVAVYQSADDKVYIAYHDPVGMTSGYDLAGHKVIGKVIKGLDKLTSAAIAETKEK